MYARGNAVCDSQQVKLSSFRDQNFDNCFVELRRPAMLYWLRIVMWALVLFMCPGGVQVQSIMCCSCHTAACKHPTAHLLVPFFARVLLLLLLRLVRVVVLLLLLLLVVAGCSRAYCRIFIQKTVI